jgi:hypothetical protein
MENQEQKQQLYNKQLLNLSHLENYFEPKVKGLENDSVYFHIEFWLDDKTYISSQSDIGNNFQRDYPYAMKLNIISDNKTECIDIFETWFENIVISWSANKERVMSSLKTLSRVREHMIKIECYAVDYVNNLIIGESINDITNDCINELKTVNKLVQQIESL